jgi:2-acylglycerol O-acyltransferase 2
MRIWNFLSEYFPVRLVKTCDLPANKNYVFGLHPHGILCFNTVTNFCSQGTKFNEKYPDIRPYTLALDSQFKMPIHRDVFMALGKSLNLQLKSCLN